MKRILLALLLMLPAVSGIRLDYDPMPPCFPCPPPPDPGNQGGVVIEMPLAQR